jgi:hypothetical protein
LEGVVLDKRSLQRVQVPIIGESLDRHDLGILMRDGKGEAAVHPPSIKQNSTGTALPMVTAFFRTSEPKMLTQCVKERRSGIDGKLVGCSIHLQGDRKIHNWCDSL